MFRGVKVFALWRFAADAKKLLCTMGARSVVLTKHAEGTGADFIPENIDLLSKPVYRLT